MAYSKKSYTTGFDEMKKVLDKLPDRIQKKVVQESVTAGARVWKKAVVAAAPVDESGGQSAASQKYGHLKKNIKIERLRKVRKSAKGSRVVTGDSFWGMFLEFGRRAGKKISKSGKVVSWGEIVARPWFRPAIDSTADAALAAMQDQLGKGIEREAEKLAGEYKVAKKSLGVK